MHRKQTQTLVIVVLIIFGVLAAIYMVKEPVNGQTIQSQGTYEMSVQPDEAAVYINIQTKSKSSEEAKTENTEITEKVRAALFDLGLEKSDLETQNFNIYPQYDWEDGKRVDKGFTATNTIKIRTKDFDLVGKIVDAAADNGALINSISFELSTAKENELKAIALAEASKDAKNKAEAIVAGLGQRLGKIVSVSTSDYNYRSYPVYAIAEGGSSDMLEAKQAATNIDPKNLDIYANVNVVFKIK